MKNFLLFLLLIALGFGAYVAFKWVSEDEVTLGEQINAVRDRVSESYDDTAVSNTADSASKLGNTLGKRLKEAQGSFEYGK